MPLSLDRALAVLAQYASKTQEALPDPPGRSRDTGGAQVTRQVPQYGTKVSSWGSETFKIVIPVENHPQKPKNRLAYYHPLLGVGMLISGQI